MRAGGGHHFAHHVGMRRSGVMLPDVYADSRVDLMLLSDAYKNLGECCRCVPTMVLQPFDEL